MSRWWLLLSVLVSVPVRAQVDGAPLSVREVVATVREHNPQLKAALLQLESAEWNLRGSEAAYVAVVEADAQGSQQATPNVLGNNVRINKIRRGDFGAQISKHLLYGTDLTLRISNSIQKNELVGGISSIPATGAGTTTSANALAGLAQGFGVGSFGPLYGYLAKASLKQPLWRGRGTAIGEAQIRQARVNRTTYEHTRDRVSSELLRDVLTAYWELWYADAAVGIQVQSLGLATRQRDEARARSETGSLAPAEVYTFDTQVATRDQDLVDAETTRAQRAHELSRLLGNNEREAPIGQLLDEPLAASAFARDLTEQRALRESAVVQEQESAVELARVQRQSADDPKKPRLDLESYVQAQGLGNQSRSDAANMWIHGRAVSGVVTLTFESAVNSRARDAELAKARIAVDIAEEQLRTARQQVLSDVRSALDREAAGERKVELAQRTTEIAERQLGAEEARYRTGSSTAIAVREAEDSVRSAKLRLARARADLAQAALVVEHLTGELLARYAAR